MEPRTSFTHKLTFFLIALVISTVSFPGALRAQQSEPTPAKVPDAVAIPRPSAKEIEIARRGLEKFLADADEETKAVIEKYPGLVEVRPPRANSAIVPNLAPFFRRKHEANLEVAKRGDAEVLFMGDSITDFWRNEQGPFAGKTVFDKYFGDWKVANFGIAGDTTQGVLYRLQNGEGEGFQPKAVMLMIGTNNIRRNTAAEIAEGIGAVVLELQNRFPKAKILLLAVFPRGRSDDPARRTIAEINRIIARLHDGDRVHFLDIGEKFLDADGNIPRDVMSDGLHPSTKGYEIWAEAVKEPLTKLMESDAPKQAPKEVPKPVIFTTEEDHRNMMAQLGITKLRPGRNANSDAPNAANYDEAKANPYPELPEILKTTSGKKVDTPEMWWKQRRPEIVELLEREVYGRIPPNVPDVKWEVRKTREVEVGGKPAIQKELVGVVDNSACPEIEVNISLSLTLPKDAKGPVPVLMSFGWTPFDLERSNFRGFGRRGDGPRPPSKRELLIAAGWGCATLNPSSVQDDAGGWQRRRFGRAADPNAKPTGAGLTRGIIGLTNLGQPRKPDQWGALRAWGWGASRALDYLETVPEVDSKRVGIAGVSRYGKAALVTMAFDRRFAMGLIASSGAGGTALHRRNFGESLENLAASGEYHWMAGNYLKYAAEESSFGRRTADDLPVDSHMTIGLCAPRLTFISHGIPEKGDAHWLDHQGSFMATIAAQPVYRLLGARDLGRSDDYLKEKMPAVNVDMLDGALAWRQHDGGHTDGPNVEHFIRWAEAQWGEKKNKNDSRNSQRDRRSLKKAVGDRFKLGVGVGHVVLRNPDDVALIKRHFQILTPENCMKPRRIHPAEDKWNFEAPDRFVEFARANQLEVVGHCLVWAKDDRTAEWMMTEDGEPVSRATLLRRIETHIHTVVERYGDVVTMWDVVNEAIGDSNDGLLRDSIYSRTTGIDFIVTAFKAARAKDPDALLIYNDYNGHKPGKREKLIELLTQLKQKGAPVDAYGMQGHFELGDDSLPQLRETFDQLRKLDIKVVVSELDIDVVTRGRWWADGGKYRNELVKHNPYQDGIPEEIERKQIEQYVALFKLFDEYSDIIERVSFWNLHDGQSWLNYFPWRRVNYPLLFDRNRKPKPVFDAVYSFLQTRPSTHAPIPRRDPNSRLAHEQLLAKTTQGKIDIYFQGDSITRRWGATDYPKLLAHWKKNFHGWNAANFAWGGDTTHNILWRMRNGELDGISPKVIVLQAGTNNLPWHGAADPAKVDEVVNGIKAIIDEFQKRVPEATIILTALFPRTQNMELAPTIEQINKRLETLTDGKRIRFLNMNDQLADSSGRLRPGVSSDGLHLEEPGYEIWARALKPIFKEILGPPAQEDLAPPPTGDPSATNKPDRVDD